MEIFSSISLENLKNLQGFFLEYNYISKIESLENLVKLIGLRLNDKTLNLKINSEKENNFFFPSLQKLGYL